MDKFYFTRFSCSIASLALLVECEHPIEPVRLEMTPEGAGDESFAALSPLRQVPVLHAGSIVLRETGAIFEYLSLRHERMDCFAKTAEERVAVSHWIGFLGGTVHPLFRILFRPQRFVGREEQDQKNARLHTERYLLRALSVIETQLAGRGWILGRRTAIDFYLFVFTRWLGMLRIPLSPVLNDFHDRVAALPAMRSAMVIEAN
ncbi:glutathione S-transferase family protein [Bradyrhizobium tunisiense]|uniref:glutathione S-transferase family protein n=1 Tax=Bradyrhizobium tunisiense TaxID=3278709 RepID=UPI0035DC2264